MTTEAQVRRLRETWKDVSGFVGMYRVSNEGQVFSVNEECILKHWLYRGYRYVSLSKKSVKCKRRVHRLVLEAFVGPCPEGHEGAHLNGNRADNRLENLAWVTPKENSSHRTLHGTLAIGARNGKARLTDEKVSELLGLHAGGSSCRQLSEQAGVNVATVEDIIHGRTWRHVPRPLTPPGGK